MFYDAYQSCADALFPMQYLAASMAKYLEGIRPWCGDQAMLRGMAAGCNMFAQAGVSHNRPSFGIDQVMMDGQMVLVTEEETDAKPFCTLLHFKKSVEVEQPRVLVVAPMSGHFATLLRGSVRALLPDHDVWITDWKNARHVPLVYGGFGFDDFVGYIMRFLRVLGPGVHVVAVCQPSVPVMAAVSLMSEGKDPAQPASMTLIGGPIDTRINPTRVNEFAKSRPLDWFVSNVIGTVPLRHPGALRRVYPGFLQIAGFMSMNLDRHVNAHAKIFSDLTWGDGESAHATQAFYEEYLTVMDLPAEFYLQTVRDVFQEHSFPTGKLKVMGCRVDPATIERTALLTIEGEKDDITGIGQTEAAHELCCGLPAGRHRRHVQPGVGHYGLFNGRRWATEIYPIVKDHIRLSELQISFVN